MRVWMSPLLFFALIGSAVVVAAQEPAQVAVSPGRFAGAQRVAGEVVAVHGDTIDVKAADGAATTIVTTTNTLLSKGAGEPFKVADLKPGDGVLAVGQLDAAHHALHAMFVAATDAAALAKLKADLGKTYIAGRIAAIDTDALRITVQRIDNVQQVIAVDESTSFRRPQRGARGGGGAFMMGGGEAAAGTELPGESITLADVHVGDRLAGPGALRGGTFVAKQLLVTTPREIRGHGAGAAGAASGTDAATGAGAPPR